MNKPWSSRTAGLYSGPIGESSSFWLNVGTFALPITGGAMEQTCTDNDMQPYSDGLLALLENLNTRKAIMIGVRPAAKKSLGSVVDTRHAQSPQLFLFVPFHHPCSSQGAVCLRGLQRVRSRDEKERFAIFTRRTVWPILWTSNVPEPR